MTAGGTRPLRVPAGSGMSPVHGTRLKQCYTDFKESEHEHRC